MLHSEVVELVSCKQIINHVFYLFSLYVRPPRFELLYPKILASCSNKLPAPKYCGSKRWWRAFPVLIISQFTAGIRRTRQINASIHRLSIGHCEDSYWHWTWVYLAVFSDKVLLNDYFIQCYLFFIFLWLNLWRQRKQGKIGASSSPLAITFKILAIHGCAFRSPYSFAHFLRHLISAFRVSVLNVSSNLNLARRWGLPRAGFWLGEQYKFSHFW